MNVFHHRYPSRGYYTFSHIDSVLCKEVQQTKSLTGYIYVIFSVYPTPIDTCVLKKTVGKGRTPLSYRVALFSGPCPT